ncbi:MAG TPA: UTP--glucose-1-phosphate uridylyltransferase [Candidatus Eremiobacteraeota bacterium]|nr:MAG: UTP--glucose-1-phosphate uridylyltransferase [bacterium ADurb.Bin363]HPZ10058.1 UTP--glucose-1-phosphate uridylyltransferase [Candidatus Eremiobacteraeota bacterium]
MIEQFIPFASKMEKEGLPEIVIKNFEYYYKLLLEGQGGFISEEQIMPVESLPDMESFPERFEKTGQKALNKCILLKLNGGLGTSMGLEKAKSLLAVKNGLSFLDIIARQAIACHIPLVLMNSFATQEDSLDTLKQYKELRRDIPSDFLQHKVPKIRKSDLSPATYPEKPDLEWCPPGHGDIYTSLITSGMLHILLEEGYLYAFVSNADNLGAVMNKSILGYFSEHNIPFMMEVSDRTEADKKGGHLAKLPEGQLILRESAQCLPEEMNLFQDIKRYKYFNTNNLWINLLALKDLMEKGNNILGLPMIRNEKTLNPRDGKSTPVYQLETAMGSAIAVFKGARAIRVPRTRFAPVKTSSDLLAVRSDAYILTEDFRIIQDPSRKIGQIVIDLDAKYYKLIQDMERRFPYGIPSLIDCEKLSIKGDIKFGQNVILKGNVRLVNEDREQVCIEDGSVIEG